MSLATLNGVPCARVRLQWPAWGLWWADVELADVPAPVPAVGEVVTLVIADGTFSGAVVSGGVLEGRAVFRIVAGRGKWHTPLARRGYQNDAGVKVSQVLTDAADSVGEPNPVGMPAVSLGSHFARPDGLGSALLHLVAPRAWYAQADGVVSLVAPAATPYTGDGVIESQDPAAGFVCLSLVASIAGVVPGVVITDYNPASDVEITVDDRGLSAVVCAGAVRARRLQAWVRIVDAVDPNRRYRASYEYRVVRQEGERLTLQSVRASSGMPDLARVPVRPGMAGLKANHLPGSVVVVSFLEGSPARPYVHAFDAADAPGWRPVELELSSPIMRAVADMLTVAGGAAAVTRDDHLQAALVAIDSAISTGLTAVGEGGAASGNAAASAYAFALGAWPPATAADSLETD